MRLQLAAPMPEDTRAVGRALAPLLRGGDALALTGELGAGKTTFVQGLAVGLGFGGTVASPTFTLVREYAGRLRVYHVDVYRLERVQDVLDLGLEEMAVDDGVLAVEWGDAVEALLPEDHLLVELTVPGQTEERRIEIRGVGSSWAERWDAVRDAVAGWEAR
jgi:tRNA threonylcarbamoyladenosine biosynthesis protein TsaE